VIFQLYVSSVLTPRLWFFVPIDSRLDAPYCRSGLYSGDTHLLPRLGSLRKLPSHQAHRLITIPAEPSRLWSENLRNSLIQVDKKPKFGMYDLEEATREEQRKFGSVEGEVPVPVGLPPLACCDCGFESPPGAWISIVSFVRCQVEVSASGWSLVQRSPTECDVFECDHESLTSRRP
jgi:hypothetical protein